MDGVVAKRFDGQSSSPQMLKVRAAPGDVEDTI